MSHLSRRKLKYWLREKKGLNIHNFTDGHEIQNIQGDKKEEDISSSLELIPSKGSLLQHSHPHLAQPTLNYYWERCCWWYISTKYLIFLSMRSNLSSSLQRDFDQNIQSEQIHLEIENDSLKFSFIFHSRIFITIKGLHIFWYRISVFSGSVCFTSFSSRLHKRGRSEEC